MATKIEWVKNLDSSQGKVLEVTGGCTKCSVGCQYCWAIKEVWRMAHNPLLGDKWQGLVEKTSSGLNWTGKIKLFEDALKIPLKRKKPTTYFIDSKADLFHEAVPFEFRDKVLAMAGKTGLHTYQILTKRPQRMLEYYTHPETPKRLYNAFLKRHYASSRGYPDGYWTGPAAVENEWRLPMDNIWLGVTCENQKWYDERWAIAQQIPASTLYISFEPLLSDIKLHLGYQKNYLQRLPDWAIFGCESGPKRRPCKIEWVRNIVEQCKEFDVPPFVKQLSINGKVSKDMSEWPEDLRVREYPELKEK